MNERRVPVDVIMVSAMNAMDERHAKSSPDDLFKPARHVDRAARYLAAGEWSKAMRIFEGILALNPGDGEAWNNLGFCQLGESAVKALPLLRRGPPFRTLYRPSPSQIRFLPCI
jgi:Tfp pilus assembly protein PilF